MISQVLQHRTAPPNMKAARGPCLGLRDPITPAQVSTVSLSRTINFSTWFTTIGVARLRPCRDIQTQQQLDFVPLRGERDEEHQFGVTIPFKGWTLDADNF